MIQPRVRVLTRMGCHLCDDVIATVSRVCTELGVGWELVDIDTDPQLRDTYTDQVPVTFVDGYQHDFWRLDEARFRAALAGS